MNFLLLGAFIYLFTAVISVPLCKRFGLGSVLGYLLAGIVIGPALGLVGEETESIQQVAEFGIVMMMFLVGLELQPGKLWRLRYSLLGLGGLQVLLSVAVIYYICIALFGLPWQKSLVIGCVLSLSSTAIVLQTMSEKNLLHTAGGQSSFSVLLFQDVAAIPMMALFPLLMMTNIGRQVKGATDAADMDLLTGMAGWVKTLLTVGVMGLMVLGGKFLSRPVFGFIASVRMREVFILFTLTLVIGVALLMSLIGLSPALGAFIAGVILANSEYRHELENNLEPFKGLLLGLFFITVGAGVDYLSLYQHVGLIVGATLGLLLVKMCVLYALGWCFRLRNLDSKLFALALAQAGEFGFVLIQLAQHNYVIDVQLSNKLTLIVTLSMLLTPLMFIFYERVLVPRTYKTQTKPADKIDQQNPIIIIGHGRFGSVINGMLTACGFQTTLIDNDPATVNGLARYGFKTYYGDGSQLSLLTTADLENAHLLVVAIDNQEQAVSVVRDVRRAYPNIKIVARAHDRSNTYDLYHAGASIIIRETFDAAIRAGRTSLELLGISPSRAVRLSNLYFERDLSVTKILADAYDPDVPHFDNAKMVEVSKTLQAETAEMMRDLIKKMSEEDDSLSNHEYFASAVPNVVDVLNRRNQQGELQEDLDKQVESPGSTPLIKIE